MHCVYTLIKLIDHETYFCTLARTGLTFSESCATTCKVLGLSETSLSGSSVFEHAIG